MDEKGIRQEGGNEKGWCCKKYLSHNYQRLKIDMTSIYGVVRKFLQHHHSASLISKMRVALIT